MNAFIRFSDPANTHQNSCYWIFASWITNNNITFMPFSRMTVVAKMVGTRMVEVKVAALVCKIARARA